MTTPTAGFTYHFNASVNDDLYENYGDPPTTNPSDGDSVEQWDNAANTDMFVFGTATPWRSAGMNGVGCLDFNGSTHNLGLYANDGSTARDLDDMINAGAFTLVISFIMTADATNDPDPWARDPIITEADGYWGLILKTSGGVHTLEAYIYDSAPRLAPQVILQDTLYVAQMRYNGTNLTLSVNNGTEASTASGSVGAVTGQPHLAYNGNGKYAAVKIGELLTYDTALSASNDAYTYMREKWLNEGGGGSIIPQIMQQM